MSESNRPYILIKALFDALKAHSSIGTNSVISSSLFVETSKIASIIGEDKTKLKSILQRDNVKMALSKFRIGANFRGDHIYVYKKSGFDFSLQANLKPDYPYFDFDEEEGSSNISAMTEKTTDDNWDFDPEYFWMPPCSEDINIAIDAGQNIFMVGPAGSGKSTLLKKIFKNRGSSPMVVSFNGEVSVDDIVGSKALIPSPTGEGVVTEFIEGFLPICMRKGCPLIIDEADATPPDIQFVLHPVLMREPLLLTKNNAQYVHPQPGFVISATGNTVGRGDDEGLYVGTNILNEAYIDRYGMVVEHWYMPEQAETRVLVKRTGIHKRIAENMVLVGGLIRAAMKAEKMSSTFSTRKLLDWATLVTRGMDAGKAYIYTCINKAPKDDKKSLVEFAQKVFGASIKLNINSDNGQ